jgi:hypothetical protein
MEEGVTQVTQPNSEPRPSTDAAQRCRLPALGATCICAVAVPLLCLCSAFAVPLRCLCSIIPFIRRRLSFGRSEDGRRQRVYCMRSPHVSSSRVVSGHRGHLPLPTTLNHSTTQPKHTFVITYRIHAYARPRSCIQDRSCALVPLLLLLLLPPSMLATITTYVSYHPTPSQLRALLLPNAKCTGMAARCQRHGSLTRVSKDSHNALLRDLASLSRGGGVARPRLIEL